MISIGPVTAMLTEYGLRGNVCARSAALSMSMPMTSRPSQYANAKTSPRSWYASGSASAMKMAASAMAKMRTRSIGREVSCMLVWIEVPTHSQ